MSSNSRLTVAVHALCWLELARQRGESVLSSERIASSVATNAVVIRRILGTLREAGLVVATRGPGAGWSLAHPATQISVLDVHGALNEPGLFALHRNEPNQECPVGRGIRPVLTELYDDVETVVARELGRRTIADLLTSVLDQPGASA